MNVSDFTFIEFIASDTAKKKKIDNVPISFYIIDNLLYTACRLQKIRDILGYPVVITSGYRCDRLNRMVGGVDDSQHCIGQAVDIICPGFGSLEKICEKIEESGFEYDQLILEPTWIHISFKKEDNRRQYLNLQVNNYE